MKKIRFLTSIVIGDIAYCINQITEKEDKTATDLMEQGIVVEVKEEKKVTCVTGCSCDVLARNKCNNCKDDCCEDNNGKPTKPPKPTKPEKPTKPPKPSKPKTKVKKAE